jgi:selenocysteine lyase/cysteine desulfurase
MAELGSGAADRAALAEARSQFSHPGVYLDTASMGLPPRRSLEALHAELDRWRDGGARPADYDPYVADARARYASLVGVRPDQVAIGPQVSVFAGVVAGSLPPGSEVLTAEGDFTSILFPFHAQPRLDVREVPLRALADAVSPSTRLVSVSTVQSSDGTVTELAELREACAAAGAQILLDATHAVGWLPVDASQYAYTIVAGYKWLLAPRGTAFMTVQDGLLEGLVPANAGWYAGEDPWSSIYGSPLRLAGDARRLDVSPAWHSWVGAVPALDLIGSIAPAALLAHCVGMANRFREGVGLPPGDSAIVSAATDDSAAERMRDADIAGSVRAGRLRFSFHLCTDADDVDRAVDILRGHVSV